MIVVVEDVVVVVVEVVIVVEVAAVVVVVVVVVVEVVMVVEVAVVVVVVVAGVVEVVMMVEVAVVAAAAAKCSLYASWLLNAQATRRERVREESALDNRTCWNTETEAAVSSSHNDTWPTSSTADYKQLYVVHFLVVYRPSSRPRVGSALSIVRVVTLRRFVFRLLA